MKSKLFAISCFLVLPLLAQNAAPRPRIQRTVAAVGETPTAGETESLNKNITIRLHGTTSSGTEVDLSLSGIGPVFIADQIMNDDMSLRCQYTVSEVDNGYKVSYNLSAQLRVEVEPRQHPLVPGAINPNPPPVPSASYQYREVTLSGTVLCSLDRPQVLIRNGSKTLQLTITRTKDAE